MRQMAEKNQIWLSRIEGFFTENCIAHLQSSFMSLEARMEKLVKNVTNNDLVDEKHAASILGVSPGTLQVWRSTGRYGIPFIKVGRLVKYRLSVLNEWIESRTRTSGTTA